MARAFIVPIAYLAPILLVLFPALFPANALAGGDWTYLLYPFYSLSRDVFWSEGRLPLWNNLILGGNPHLVSLNVLVLYPTELLSLPLRLRASTFYAGDMILHLLVAGLGFRWWMLRRGLPGGAAFLGGLAYMLGGHALTLAGAGHPHTIRCLAWLPLVLAWAEMGLGSGRARWFALSGMGLALCILTAAMQFVAYAIPVAAGWILLSDAGGTGAVPLRRRLSGLGVLLAVACGLGAVLWLPGLEYWANSQRFSPRPGMAGEWALSGWEALTWLVPGFFGDSRVYYGPHMFRDSNDFPGLAVLALAAAGFVRGWRMERRFVVLAGVAVLLALGPSTFPGRLLSHLPVFGGFRNPLRWMTFFHLALCVLAARGWERIISPSEKPVARRISLAAGALGALCLFVAWDAGPVARRVSALPFVDRHSREGTVPPGAVEASLRVAGLRTGAAGAATAAALWFLPGAGLLVQGGLGLALAADLLSSSYGHFQSVPLEEQERTDPVAFWLAGRRHTDRTPWRAATDEYFALPNRRMSSGVEWASGYHGLPLARYSALFEEARAFPSTLLLSVLNVRYVVSASGGQEGWKPAVVLDMPGGGKAAIIENSAALQRAFLAREVVPVAGMEEVLAGIRAPGWNPGIVLTDTRLPASAPKIRLSARGSIALTEGGREHIAARTALDGPGLLVFSENWYPAWKSFIDGKRVPQIRAYGALRALAMPAGEHEVEMIYDSVTLKIGIWLSLLFASALACLAVRLQADR